jgi:hypothetical protein
LRDRHDRTGPPVEYKNSLASSMYCCALRKRTSPTATAIFLDPTVWLAMMCRSRRAAVG